MNVEQANPLKEIAHLKPQHEWGWQVVVDLYLAGMGAGSLATGLLMDWLGYSPYESRAILLWGPILVALGALFLVSKLGIKRRFLNTILNPRTSWLSRGFYILSVCIVVGSVILGISILPLLGIDISSWSPFITVLDIICFIFALGAAIYTGILIQSVKYVPLWNTVLLPALFTVSALASGSMVIILSTYFYDLLAFHEGYSSQMMDILVNTQIVLIVLEAAVLALYLFFRYRAEGEGKSSVRLLLSGNLKQVFWLGIVAAGFFLPLLLLILYLILPDYSCLLITAGVFVLTGSFFLRYGVVYAGIKEEHPLRRFIEIQNNLRILKESR